MPRRAAARAAALLAAAAAAVAVAAAQDTCRNPVSDCSIDNDYFPDKISIERASFTLPSVEYSNTHVDVTVSPGPDTQYKYRLVRCGCEGVAPAAPDGVVAISVPPKGLYLGDTVIAAMVTTEIDAKDFIKAVSDVTNAYSPQVRRAVENGEYASAVTPADLIGNDDVTLSIIGSFYLDIDGYQNATADGLETPFFVSAEQDEVDPLGRAEWIKVFGLILNRELSTTNTYDSIKFRYNTVKDQAFSVRRRPSALVNFPFSGTWNQPGGLEYTAAFLRDANVDYRFANDGNSVANSLTPDEVVDKFGSALYWVNMGRFPNTNDDSVEKLLDDGEVPKDEIAAFKQLAAVKCGNVWSQAKRSTNDGNGNDYFEQGALRPDLILTDMLAIFHPDVSDLKPDELTFYYNMGSPADDQTEACPYNELPLDAPDGKVFRTTELSVAGVDRFEVEDKLAAGEIMKDVSEAAGVKENEMEVFFDRAVEDDDSDTFVKVRAMIDEGDEDDYDDEAVASAFDDALGGDASVDAVASESSSSSRSPSDDDGLSGGAIAGIVVGSLVALAVVAFGSYLFASQRSKKSAYTEVKNRFWEEHGVRLAEDGAQNQGRSAAGRMDDDVQPAV